MKKKRYTVKELGLVPGTTISETYNNQPNDYKIVDTKSYSYRIYGGEGKNSYPGVAVVYDATIIQKTGNCFRVITTIEHGPTLTEHPSDGLFDNNSLVFAGIAVQAIHALEACHRVRTYRTVHKSKSVKSKSR